MGHKLGASLAKQIPGEVETLVERIETLLEAGWRAVRVVTDHGWLLLPEGLPKFELPKHATATKWTRCAAIPEGAQPDAPRYPWFWNRDSWFATPSGIAAFRKGEEYAHGGVSPQECVLPEILVEAAAESARAKITGLRWKGMSCHVKVETNDPGARIDVRGKAHDPSTSLVGTPKSVGEKGEVRLLVEESRHEGQGAIVVVLDASGRILDKMATAVGESS